MFDHGHSTGAAAGRGLFQAALFVAILVLALAVSLAFGMTIHPLIGLAAVAAVPAAWIFIRYREIGILSLFFLVPLGPLLWLTSDGTISVQKLLTAGLIGVWAVELLIRRDKYIFAAFPRSRLNIWGLLFLVVFLVSLPWCLKVTNALDLMMRWTFHLLLFYFIVFNVTSFAMLRRCFLAVLAVGVLIGAIAHFESYTEKSVLELTGRQVQLIKGGESGELVSTKLKTIREYQDVAWSRSMATFKGPNELGLFLVFVTGVALFFFFRASTWWMKGVYLLIILLLVGALDTTGSRGALSGLIALFGAFIILTRFPFKWFLIAASFLGLVIMMTAGSSDLGDQWRGGLSLDEIRDDDRVEWLEMSLMMMADHPVAGIGLGQFEPRYFEYRVPDMHKDYSPPHNIFFQIGAESGALGLLLLLFMIYAVIRETGRLRVRPRADDHVLLSNVLLATFAGVMTFSMTSNVLLDETFWTFITIAAVVASLYAAMPEERKEPEEDLDMVVVALPPSFHRLPPGGRGSLPPL